MTDKMTCRTFPTAFKLAAIKRLQAGEPVLPLARKLGVSRKLLHGWRKAFELHGPAGLNRKRGPKPGPRKLRRLTEPAAKGSSGELARARAKIAELERKNGIPSVGRRAPIASGRAGKQHGGESHQNRPGSIARSQRIMGGS